MFDNMYDARFSPFLLSHLSTEMRSQILVEMLKVE